MNQKSNEKGTVLVVLFAYLCLALLALHMGTIAYQNPTLSLLEIAAGGLQNMMHNPINVFPLRSESGLYLMTITTLMAFIVAYFYFDVMIHRHDRAKKEYGNAYFDTNFKKYNEECSDPKGTSNHNGPYNMILTKRIFASLDPKISGCNNNVMVIGGSGSGKTYSLIKPNVLQRNTSYIATDPNGEILKSCGYSLEDAGYKIKVLDLTDMSKSDHYNPIAYVRNEEDVITLAKCLIKNTTGKKEGGSDPFWEMSEIALLEAMIFYLIEQETELIPRSFAGVMMLLSKAEISENGSSTMNSPLDVLINGLEAERKGKKRPCMAAKQYRIFKQAGGVVCSKRQLNHVFSHGY